MRPHNLPGRNNELMTENLPPYVELVARRRLGQTDLTLKAGQSATPNLSKSKYLGTFDYAHLRAPLPKGIVSGIFKPSPNSYFLMRRSQDGYISATGMFKASFPYAEADEEEQERKYIKSLATTSSMETAGNIWVPPQHAIELAKDYKILPWIQALLDNADIEPTSSTLSIPNPITPPPKFEFLQPQEALAPPTPSSRARSLRSASPSKIASPKKTDTTRARKSRAPSETPSEPKITKAAGRKLQRASKAASVETESKSSEATEESEVKSEIQNDTTEAPIQKPGSIEEEAPIQEPPVVRVNVDTDVETKGDVEITHTHVEVEMPAAFAELPLPEDTAAMIAKAKEMVEAAVRGADTEAGPSESKKLKRKVEEVEADEEGQVVVPAPAKKPKVETELRKEKVKTRALIGLSATLAIGAIIPYVMGVL